MELDVRNRCVARIQPDGVGDFSVDVLESKEVVWHLGWSGHLCGPVEAEDEEVDHEAVVLDDEAGELEAPDDPVGVGVVHVLVVDRHVVLGSHAVSDVVVHDQPDKRQRYCHQSIFFQFTSMRVCTASKISIIQ